MLGANKKIGLCDFIRVKCEYLILFYILYWCTISHKIKNTIVLDLLSKYEKFQKCTISYTFSTRILYIYQKSLDFQGQVFNFILYSILLPNISLKKYYESLTLSF